MRPDRKANLAASRALLEVLGYAPGDILEQNYGALEFDGPTTIVLEILDRDAVGNPTRRDGQLATHVERVQITQEQANAYQAHRTQVQS